MPAFSIRNIDDDSIVTFATTFDEADKLVKEIAAGDFDNNPRMTYIVEE